jgi:hypothetical protein
LTANVVATVLGWDRLLFRHLYGGESDWVGGTTLGNTIRPERSPSDPSIGWRTSARS